MIGELQNRVTLQEVTLTPSGGGGFSESWGDVDEVYAAIRPLSGSESLRFHQLCSSATHRITIRHRSDVTPAMRIVKDGVVYGILGVFDREGRGQYLDILAVVHTPA